MEKDTRQQSLGQCGFSLSPEQRRFLLAQLPRVREKGRLTLLKMRADTECFALLVAPLEASPSKPNLTDIVANAGCRGLPCMTGTQLAEQVEYSADPALAPLRHGILGVWHPHADRGPYGFVWAADERYTVVAVALERDVQEALAEIEANWRGDPGKISCRLRVEFAICGNSRRVRGVRLARPEPQASQDGTDHFDSSSSSALWK